TVPSTGVGLTASIGAGLFTEYLLPFEVTSVLILMALVGAITLARQTRTPLLAAPGNVTSEPAVLTAGGELALKPGDTAATGRAYARHQIETGEAAAPSPPAGTGRATDAAGETDEGGGEA
ncbi:MAG TPA: NADH-quinone oxidoreductase subunit J, partial [Pyrinomonadaceae bacterium]|nr:NADH-quinone oxidoreductase subunit J [Pyrinomonadaceae bacterium]